MLVVSVFYGAAIVMFPITPVRRRIPRIKKTTLEIILMVSGLRKRTITWEPMMTSRNDAVIKAVAEPRPTQRTYRGFSPASNKVLIWVLSPNSDRKTTPNAEKNRRQLILDNNDCIARYSSPLSIIKLARFTV